MPDNISNTKCPKTGEPVLEMDGYFRFPGYPRTYCMKELAGRAMTAEDYASILKGEDQLFEGFLSKKQEPFSAMIRHDEELGKFSFAFPPSDPLSVLCPKSGEPVDNREKYYYFPGYPDARFWKDVSGRKMEADDYRIILEAAPQPVEFHDFISRRTGKPFSGPLRFNEGENTVEWAFEGKKEGGKGSSRPKETADSKASSAAKTREAADDNPLADF